MSESNLLSELNHYTNLLKYDVEDYLTWSSNIHNQIEDQIRIICQPGAKILDVVSHIETLIDEYSKKYALDYNLNQNISYGSAFPVGINLNNIAAHYTPKKICDQIITKSDVVTLDYGIHFDGYILDAAYTFAYDRKHLKLLECGLNACQDTASKVKANLPIYSLSSNIINIIKQNGFNSISDLCGHQIKQYKIHSGFAVPNINYDTKIKLRVGDIFTIEPFVTTGNGISKEIKEINKTKQISHYMFNYHLNDYDKLNKQNKIPEFLRPYSTLAFNSREFDKTKQKQLDKLVKNKLYNQYPPILDINDDAYVCQFETTIYIKSFDEVINYKKHKSLDKYLLV
jgi:methionine aminopeptidase type II